MDPPPIPALAATLSLWGQEETHPPFLWITLKISFRELRFFLVFMCIPDFAQKINTFPSLCL
jgi:hypothetical protein